MLDAIDREHWADVAEELGDLLLQVLFYAQMGAEAGHFTIADVLEHLNRKLVRRHPHVFGEQASAAAGNKAVVDTGVAREAAGVVANWEAIKRAEKQAAASTEGSAAPSLLDAVPRGFPALLEATKLGGKAAKVGFDWPDRAGLLDKVMEEAREIEAEVGDLLFTVVNLARHLKVDPELALKSSNRKFRTRFRAMEQTSEAGLDQQTPDELEQLWRLAKQQGALSAR